jgi:hypothetical protein
MRGETSSDRNSRAAGGAFPTSRPEPQQQPIENPATLEAGGTPSSRTVEQTLLVRLQAGVGRGGNASCLLPL